MGETNDRPTSGEFARSRWAQVLVLADQLRHNTEVQKHEHLKKCAFDVTNPTTNLVDHHGTVHSFGQALLFAKTGNFNLDNLSEKFFELKQTLDHMVKMKKNSFEQITLATSITKTALLILLRLIESIVEVMAKGTRKFPSLSSLISFIRTRANDLPIDGRLLVDWYTAADVLDLLINDTDWLVQPRKALWAMQVCNETLTWTRGVFNEKYRSKSNRRPIFDREDSIMDAAY